VQETPGLRGDPEACAEALAAAIEAQQARFAAAERDLSQPRAALQDGRIDALLYFLPVNARISESDLDLAVIRRVAKLVPVIPVMCKVLIAQPGRVYDVVFNGHCSSGVSAWLSVACRAITDSLNVRLLLHLGRVHRSVTNKTVEWSGSASSMAPPAGRLPGRGGGATPQGRDA
jgi:Septin